jgi:hypothetical protein
MITMTKRLSASGSSEVDYPTAVERCRVLSLHNQYRQGMVSGDIYKEAIKSYCRLRVKYYRNRCASPEQIAV